MDDESEDEDEDESESDGSHLNVDLSEDDDEPFSAFPPEAEAGEEDEAEEENYAEPTRRIAAVNLDWDNLRAGDLFSVFNSFLKLTGKGPAGEGSSAAVNGRLEKVEIFPSEFGKSRLELEEKAGPGGGIFKSKGKGKKKDNKKERIVIKGKEVDEEDDEEEEDESEEEEDSDGDEESDFDGPAKGRQSKPSPEFSDDEDEAELQNMSDLEIISDPGSEPSDAGSDDIDMAKLREYQLERLRYYYAIATFSTVEAAKKVLSECNGTEFERTANMFDLTYVPDEMEFDADEVKWVLIYRPSRGFG